MFLLSQFSLLSQLLICSDKPHIILYSRKCMSSIFSSYYVDEDSDCSKLASALKIDYKHTIHLRVLAENSGTITPFARDGQSGVYESEDDVGSPVFVKGESQLLRSAASISAIISVVEQTVMADCYLKLNLEGHLSFILKSARASF